MAEEAIDISGVALMQDGVLNVGMEIGYPPFEEFAEDGVTPIGYDVDFALALGEKARPRPSTLSIPRGTASSRASA